MKNPCNDRSIDRFFGTYQKPDFKQTKNKTDIKRRFTTMTLQKDCFAYRVGRCAIMTETICRYGTCSFFKTKEQDRKDRLRYGDAQAKKSTAAQN